MYDTIVTSLTTTGDQQHEHTIYNDPATQDSGITATSMLYGTDSFSRDESTAGFKIAVEVPAIGFVFLREVPRRGGNMKHEYTVKITPPEDAEIMLRCRIIREKSGQFVTTLYAGGQTECRELYHDRVATFLSINGVEIGEMVSVTPIKGT
jgi:hypothetical protein